MPTKRPPGRPSKALDERLVTVAVKLPPKQAAALKAAPGGQSKALKEAVALWLAAQATGEPE